MRVWCGFYVVGYVVMPEHVHLPRTGTRHTRPGLADGEADSFTETARGDSDRLRLETPAFAKNAKGRATRPAKMFLDPG